MILIFSALYFPTTIASPVNLTALQTEIAPGWVADPTGRGTWSLLYSCLFTLLLCVYTAIHLNVPPPNETKLAFWLRKTKWVAIAIFAAELVVYTAFEQWFLARKFMKDINEAAAKNRVEKNKDAPPQDSSVPSKPPFDMIYAHYAVMGGFAADVTDLHNVLQRVTLTTQGILFLAKHGIYLETSRGNIQDKSKADTLAKGLVCFQVLWIVGQAIERKVAGYPITLLEIHTIVHVVCVVVMYGMWIRKPLNVQDPTIIDLQDRWDILAYMLQEFAPPGDDMRGFQSTYISRTRKKSTVNVEGLTTGNSDPTFLWYRNSPTDLSEMGITPNEVLPKSNATTADNPILTKYDMGVTTPNIAEEFAPRHNSRVVCRLISGQALTCGLGPDISWEAYIPSEELPLGSTRMHYIPPKYRICAVSLSRADVNRLELAAKFITKTIEQGYEPSTANDTSSLSSEEKKFYSTTYPLSQFAHFPTRIQGVRILLAKRAPNFEGSVFDNIYSTTLYLVAAMALIPTAYGFVHLRALSIIFPTTTERLLWKVSCYYLIATAGTIALLFIIIYVDDLIYEAYEPHIERGPISWIFSTLGDMFHHAVRKFIDYSFLGIVGLLYVGARLYIVIEAFISLRHVPIGVYQTPKLNIMGNIPHL